MVNEQRKGQWIYNKLRPTDEELKHIGCESGSLQYNNIIANRLWNLSDTKFDLLLKELAKEKIVLMEICEKHHRQLDSRNKCRDCETS